MFAESRYMVATPTSMAHQEQLKAELIFHIVYQDSHIVWWKSRFFKEFLYHATRIDGEVEMDKFSPKPSVPSSSSRPSSPPVEESPLAGKGSTPKWGSKGQPKGGKWYGKVTGKWYS